MAFDAFPHGCKHISWTWAQATDGYGKPAVDSHGEPMMAAAEQFATWVIPAPAGGQTKPPAPTYGDKVASLDTAAGKELLAEALLTGKADPGWLDAAPEHVAARAAARTQGLAFAGDPPHLCQTDDAGNELWAVVLTAAG